VSVTVTTYNLVNPHLAFHTKQQVIRLLHHQSRTDKLKSLGDGDGVAQRALREITVHNVSKFAVTDLRNRNVDHTD
jgi:hypothetical protein